MDCPTSGSPVLHYLPDFAQIYVHRISDAIQSSHSLPPSSPFAFILPQYQGLFQWVSSLHQVAKALELQLQHISMNISSWFPFGFTGLFSLQSTGLSRVFSSTTIQKHQIFTAQPSSLVAQMVKHLPAMQETRVRSLGWEDLLEKKTATHSSTLAWKIPRTEEPGRLQSMGLQRVRHDWATSLSLSYMHWETNHLSEWLVLLKC